MRYKCKKFKAVTYSITLLKTASSQWWGLTTIIRRHSTQEKSNHLKNKKKLTKIMKSIKTIR